MIDTPNLRIVEIGGPFVKYEFFEQTQSFAPRPLSPDFGVTLSVQNLLRLHRALHGPDLSLIVCYPGYHSPWHPRLIGRALFDRSSWQGYPKLAPAIAPNLLRLPVTAPIAVVDAEDAPLIGPADLHLLARCRCYFKRELPTDRWRLFMKTAYDGLPSARFRRQSKLRQHIDKLRPLPLGLPFESKGRLPPEIEKSADVFFAGDVQTASTLRQRGISELLELRARGYRIDIPEGSLPRDEFYRRCAQAWTVWSPEGRGWDCFRHYESLACGSVPVINQPTIERYKPLVPGIHAFYYDPEPGSLTRTIETALADKPRLQAMAQAGKAHVLAHHTPAAIARYIVETTLADVPQSAAPGPIRNPLP